MTRVLRIAAAVLLLAALSGAESCTSTNRPPWERQCVGDDCMTATITVDCSGPCEITVHVIEVGTTKFDRTGPEPIAGGRYEQTVTYASGWVLEITVEVTARSDDTVDALITDGPDNSEHRQAQGSVAILLVTRQ
ncbi:MAG TPA: hypothetical protein VFY84_12620 [Jiangellales bacterium]|nr:hypothetical protein [Jiangellales bacterium]